MFQTKELPATASDSLEEQLRLASIKARKSGEFTAEASATTSSRYFDSALGRGRESVAKWERVRVVVSGLVVSGWRLSSGCVV